MSSRLVACLVMGTLVACSGKTRELPQAPNPSITSARSADALASARPPEPLPEDAGGVASSSAPDPPLPPAAPPPRFAAPYAKTASIDDGVWTSLVSHEGVALLYQSTVHSSAKNGRAKVTVVAIDLVRVALGLVAGTREPVSASPRGVPSARPGVVPPADLPRLIAVTNGGWRSEHGHFGMRVGASRFAPPKPKACTVGLSPAGGLTIAPWEEVAPKEADFAAWRQAPACLLHRRVLHPALVQETLTRNWGAAVDGGVEIPRTALGVDASGRFGFFGLGESTSAKALADGLLAAGAVSVAELDINWSYTRFFLYEQATPGMPSIERSIGTKGQHAPRSYVEKSSERDFFYLARKL